MWLIITSNRIERGAWKCVVQRRRLSGNVFIFNAFNVWIVCSCFRFFFLRFRAALSSEYIFIFFLIKFVFCCYANVITLFYIDWWSLVQLVQRQRLLCYSRIEFFPRSNENHCKNCFRIVARNIQIVNSATIIHFSVSVISSSAINLIRVVSVDDWMPQRDGTYKVRESRQSNVSRSLASVWLCVSSCAVQSVCYCMCGVCVCLRTVCITLYMLCLLNARSLACALSLPLFASLPISINIYYMLVLAVQTICEKFHVYTSTVLDNFV